MNPFLPLHQYHRFAMVSNGKSSTSKNERIQFMLSLIDTHTHTTMEMAKNGIRFRRSHLSCSSFSVSSHCVNTRCEFFFYSALSFFFMFAHRRFQSKWCFFSFCSLWNSQQTVANIFRISNRKSNHHQFDIISRQQSVFKLPSRLHRDTRKRE